MVRIKYIFSILFAFLLIVSVSSCRDDAQYAQSTYETPLDSTEMDKNIKAKSYEDSISSVLKQQEERIDDLDSAKNSLNDSVKALSEKINEFEKPSNLWNVGVIIALLLSVIALIIIIIMRRNATDEKSIINMVFGDNNFMDLRRRVETLETKSQQIPTNKQSSVRNENLERIKKEISDVRFKVDELYNQNRTSHPKDYEASPKHKQGKKQNKSSNQIVCSHFVNGNGFVNGLFITTTDTKQEDSIIIIDEMSDGKGEFGILSIEQIGQTNGLDDIIERDPIEISLHDAKTYETLRQGKCEKTSEGYWKVTEPVKIKISK